MKALVNNNTLEEIRMCNQVSYEGLHLLRKFCNFQYSRGGHRIENEIAKFLEKNTTIKKFGYSFTSNGPRIEVEKWIMRNIDIRKREILI